jgi:hypothetical protein
MKVLPGSTEQMGYDVISRTNGICQSQGHGQDFAGRPNIGTNKTKQWHRGLGQEDLDRFNIQSGL